MLALGLSAEAGSEGPPHTVCTLTVEVKVVNRGVSAPLLTRRRLLAAAGIGGLAFLSARASAQSTIDLPLPGGPDARQITTAFPQKGPMILQRTRPPLLETPWDVFDKGVFTPNDRFYVRWHWALIPTEVDVDAFKLTCAGM